MDDLTQAVDEVLSSTSLSKASINRISKLRDKLSAAIDTAKQELTDAKDRVAADKAFKLSLDIALSESSSIFRSAVQAAIATSVEYNYPAFSLPLLSISDVNGLFKYTVHGTGWSKSISLSIDMDSIAGSINDYATAVTLARGALGVGQVKDAHKASETWRNKIYPSDSLYSRTIRARSSFFSAPAPYWSLLNYGNKSVSMLSDRGGGTPYPTAGPTRFVDKARDRVYKLFRTTFIEQKNINKELKAELKASITDKEAKLVNLNNLLQKLDTNFSNAKAISREIDVSIDEKDATELINKTEKVQSGGFIGKVSSGIGKLAAFVRRLMGSKRGG